MQGGGAERVAAQLINEIHKTEVPAEFVLTSQKSDNIVNTDLDESIPVISLADGKKKASFLSKFFILLSSIFCKPFELLKLRVPSLFALFSFKANYLFELASLREYLNNNDGATAVAFLQPAIPLLMLAAKDNKNIRVIFSERGDAKRLMNHRYGFNFIKQYYKRADHAVFQTFDALSYYPDIIKEKGSVISNPIKANLVSPYFGERNKNISTFCRISKQKNLPLLLKAFELVHSKHPDYSLRIIGDCLNDEGKAVKAELDRYIAENGLGSSVEFIPFRKDVHEFILKDAMYVNSSDYEGISNAMLEAMAIGMPVVCTDCPVGGAAQTINDGVNGLLVPCNDEKILADAICRIIENNDLSANLSHNAVLLRDELSLNNICQKWIELL